MITVPQCKILSLLYRYDEGIHDLSPLWFRQQAWLQYGLIWYNIMLSNIYWQVLGHRLREIQGGPVTFFFFFSSVLHFTEDIFIFFNENVWISISISLKYVRKGSINNIPALVQIIPWRRPGDKPLAEPLIVSSPTHICITRPQWVNSLAPGQF